MADHPAPSTAGDDRLVESTLKALYVWDYGSDLEALRGLYVKNLDLQWKALRDLPWERGIDRDAFSKSFVIAGVPVHKTSFWSELSPETRWQVSRRGAAWVLSNFLHGEQGALLVASQLVNAVPHLDAKLYAAAQTMDEARHVEALSDYVRLLDQIHPIAPGLRKILDDTLLHEDWVFKCVGMQVVVEGIALFTFRDMRDNTDDPLFKQLLTYVARDEARHTAYGIKYLERIVPTLSDATRRELEDFAFEACRRLMGARSGESLVEAMNPIWSAAGIDPADAWKRLAGEQELLAEAARRMGGRVGPTSGMVVPALQRVGLLSARVRGHFHEMFEQLNMKVDTGDPASPKGNPIDYLRSVPDDLEGWVLSGPG